MKRYYSFKAFPISGFPKFFDSYPTKELAMKAIKDLLSDRDGYWQSVELYRDKPRQPGYVGIERELLEEIYK